MMAYSETQIKELFEKILFEVANGRALRTVMKDDCMPDVTTFYRWLESDETKSKQYARACEDRADFIFDEMFDIADEKINDYVITKDGIEVVNNEAIQRSKLRVDTRKWALAKLNPKKYGDASKLTLEGGLELKTVDYKSYTTEDLEAIEKISEKYKTKEK